MNDLIQQFYGMTLRFDRRYADGIVQAEAVLTTNPNSPSAWAALAENYYQLGRYDDAVAAQKNAIRARGNPRQSVAILTALDQAYAAGDYRAAMRRMAEEREARTLNLQRQSDATRSRPYPRSDRPFPPNDYIATFVVEVR